MLKIFVCEDDKAQREKLTRIIENVLLIENYDMELALETDNPYEVLDNIKKNDSTGIYFLDVDLHSDINGIQLAEKIREYDPRCFIIFITVHAEMSYLTFLYKVEAMDYIIKDNYKNLAIRVKECIENAHNKYKAKVTDLQKILSIKVADKLMNIDYNSILFFETSSTIHKIVLHCENRQIEFYGKMKDIEKCLDDRFCRCHTSFIVNKDKIKEINKKDRIAYMINDEECLISTRGIRLLVK